jgi:alkylation response protein AidB-like acyl-CoA dehydrogenase
VVGDHLVVNGSKIWTTYGPVADYQELLVRTDPNSQRGGGVSWVIGDMHSPGVTIRPIKAMSGVTHFCQVFYDNVEIPLENVVGELNGGWNVAMTTLGFERGTATVSHQMELHEKVEELIGLAHDLPAPDGRRRAIEDDAIRAELATLRAEAAALRSLTALTISRGMREAVPGAHGNIVALYFAELARKVHGQALELLGGQAQVTPGDKDWVTEYLESFRWSIGGGTLEIRRNAIGERVLGLPKQPSARQAGAGR